jgi:hypothetical protein
MPAHAHDYEPPVVFISYSHDSPAHKRWVGDFASRLQREGGAEVLLDQWHVGPGDDLPAFMERLRSADRVLMVCSTAYTQKANEGKGGVGYEKMIVTGELVRDLGTSKFIPLIPPGNTDAAVPVCVQTRMYLDFRSEGTYDSSFDELVNALRNLGTTKIPPIGLADKYKRVAPEPVRPLEGELLSPLDAYALASALVRSEDYQEWQRLTRKLRTESGVRLVQFRASVRGRPSSPADLVLAGVECYSPLIAVALAAVESGKDRFRQQFSVIADILSPMGWERSGLTSVIELPKAVAFVYQALVGAMAVQSRQFDLNASLGRTVLLDEGRIGQSRLYERHDITGWIDSLGRDFVVCARFVFDLPKSWKWLLEVFGTQEEFESLVSTHYLLMQFAEFGDLIPKAQTFDPHSFNIPPVFWFTSSEVARSAMQRLLNDKNQVEAIARASGTTLQDLATLWDAYAKRWNDSSLTFKYNIEWAIMMLGNPLKRLAEGSPIERVSEKDWRS